MAWDPFALGVDRVCIASNASVCGLLTVEPILTAYMELPRNNDVGLSNGDVLLFFTDERELDGLRMMHLYPEIIG
jgi:hypothetical protein